jgi:hypothetical protein
MRQQVPQSTRNHPQEYTVPEFLLTGKLETNKLSLVLISNGCDHYYYEELCTRDNGKVVTPQRYPDQVGSP